MPIVQEKRVAATQASPSRSSLGRLRYVVLFEHAIKVLFDEFVIIFGKVVAHSGIPILPDIGEEVGLG